MNNSRNWIDIDKSQNLLMIDLSGIDLKNFNSNRSVRFKYSKTKDIRHVHSHKSNA